MSWLRTRTLAALTIPFLSAVAGAAEPGWYAGAAFAKVSTDIDGLSGGTEAHTVDDDNGFKLIAGYQALDWLAVEANYADLGTAGGMSDMVCVPEGPCGGAFDFETRSFSVAALASVSAGAVELFARAGFAHWQTDLTSVGTPQDATLEINGNDPLYGIGMRFNLGAVALRVEFEHQDLDVNSSEQLSFGATYTFGR